MAVLRVGALFDGQQLLGPHHVDVEQGVVTAVTPLESAPNDLTLAPGFIDLQVNGIDTVDVATATGDEWDMLGRALLSQGVTTWCPTLITAPLSRYDGPLDRIAAAMDRPADGRPTIAGVHLEGPFLGGAPGAHPLDLIIPPDIGWIEALPAHVVMMTIGPEHPNAPSAIAALRRRGVLVSGGHTVADDNQLDAAEHAGMSMVTHLFNAMSGLHHRTPGVAAWALAHSTIRASIIVDNVHVHPTMVRLAFAALGPTRMILVTDAVAWRAGRVGRVRLEVRNGAPRLPDDTLAGSSVTMDACIRNAHGNGVDLADVLRAATANPADALGLSDRGRVAVGLRADLVTLTRDLAVADVWVAGQPAMR